MANIAAIIITIGDELLIGQTVDTNSAWIAQRMNEMGIDVLRRVAVGDTRQAITVALDEELPRAELLIITGGLGPTSDDITKPLLCDYFGGKLVADERVRQHLLDIFAKRNRPILERNMKQAEVPDNCTVLFNRMGTAPGMWFEQGEKVIISLPGVPFEMKDIMQQEALPKIAARFRSDKMVHRHIFTAGAGESFIAEKLMDIEERLPAYIRLAYLPDASMVRLRLTGRGADETGLIKELEVFQKEIAERLGDIVISRDDKTLAQLLGESLKQKGKLIGLAESCTGGLIGHELTQIPGASAWFYGSIVSYDNSVKQHVLGVQAETLSNFGAVSEQTVREMALGAIGVLKTDYAVAVSGVLGPTGGTDRVKVGTVWMAVTDGNVVKTNEFHFYYDRERNKDMAAKMAMLSAWRFINDRIK